MGARGPAKKDTTITYHPSEQNRTALAAFHAHLCDTGQGGSMNSTLDQVVATGLSQSPLATDLTHARRRAYSATALWLYSRLKEFLKNLLAELDQMELERRQMVSPTACPACGNPQGLQCPACGHQEHPQ